MDDLHIRIISEMTIFHAPVKEADGNWLTNQQIGNLIDHNIS